MVKSTFLLIPAADGAQRTADPLGLVGDQITEADLKRPEIRELMSQASQLIHNSEMPLAEVKSLIKELVKVRQQQLSEAELRIPEKWKSVEGLFKYAVNKALPIYITYELLKIVVNGDVHFDIDFTINQTVNNYQEIVIQQDYTEINHINQEIIQIIQDD